MSILLLPFTPRFMVYTTSILVTALLVALIWYERSLLPYLFVLLAVFGALTVLGTLDLVQT